MTGGTGFFGKFLIDELLEDRWTVSVLARHPARARRLPDGVAVVQGELDDDDAIRTALRDADVLFHLAAATAGPWDTHRRVTVEGTRRMLALAREAGVRRFVLVSSIAVYDKRGLTPGTIVDESARLLPTAASAGAYARGKLEAERLAREASAAPMEVVIVRPGLIYGEKHLSFNHLGELVGSTRIAYGGPSLLLPLVEARSCAHALVALAKSPRAAGLTYHVG